MAGVSPTSAGVLPAATGAVMSDALALDIVQMRVQRELWRERASGSPFKQAYHAVARRLGLSARRVRAYHHNEVDAAGVTAQELLAADAAWRREIDALHARIQELERLTDEETPGGLRTLATNGVDRAQQGRDGEGGAVARPADQMAGVVKR